VKDRWRNLKEVEELTLLENRSSFISCTLLKRSFMVLSNLIYQ